MLAKAQLPNIFLSYCLELAAIIKNITISRPLDGKTPFEIIFNYQNLINFLQIFGCLKAILDHFDINLKKFQQNNICAIFVGCTKTYKNYIIYYPILQRFHQSTNICFFESQPIYAYFKEYLQQSHELLSFPLIGLPLIILQNNDNDKPSLPLVSILPPIEVEDAVQNIRNKRINLQLAVPHFILAHPVIPMQIPEMVPQLNNYQQ